MLWPQLQLSIWIAAGCSGIGEGGHVLEGQSSFQSVSFELVIADLKLAIALEISAPPSAS